MVSTEGREVSILVEGAAAHSVSRTSAIELGVVGTLVGTELVPCSSRFGIPHRTIYVHRSLPYIRSPLGTLQRPDPE